MNNYCDKFENTFKYPFESINDSDCIICQDTKYKQHIKLQCNHSFHKACIDRYIRSRKTECPLCRAEINITFKKEPCKYILLSRDDDPNEFRLVDRNGYWIWYHYLKDRLLTKIKFKNEGIIPWTYVSAPGFIVSIVIEMNNNRNLLFQWPDMKDDILDAFENMVDIEMFDDLIEI